MKGKQTQLKEAQKGDNIGHKGRRNIQRKAWHCGGAMHCARIDSRG